jgi:hypothetical protein
LIAPSVMNTLFAQRSEPLLLNTGYLFSKEAVFCIGESSPPLGIFMEERRSRYRETGMIDHSQARGLVL